MRACAFLLGLCAACATTVPDYPLDRDPDPAHALVAGSTDFEKVHVHQQGTGGEFNLRPSHREFLVALPPGTYVFAAFDEYEPTDDRVTFVARAGEALYIGSFLRDRDSDGNVKVVVADTMQEVESALVQRYGIKVPELKRELARSSLAPADGDFSIRVDRDAPRVRWAFGFWLPHYGHHRHHGHRHHGRRGGRRHR